MAHDLTRNRAREELAEFMTEQGLQSAWLPYHLGYASPRHGAHPQLRQWLIDLIEAKQCESLDTFFTLLGTWLSLENNALATQHLAQLLNVFEGENHQSVRPEYEWFTELWQQTTNHRSEFPILGHLLDSFAPKTRAAIIGDQP